MKSTNGLTGFFKKVLIDHSAKITVFILMISAIGYYFGSQVQLKLSLTDLLPDNHPAVVKFNKLTEVVGGVGFFTIVLNAKDGHSHLNVAHKITDALAKSDLVRSAFYHREQRFFADRLLYYLTLDQIKELEVNIADQIRTSRAKVFDLGLWDDQPKEAKPAFDGELKSQAKKTASISPYLISANKTHLLIMVKPSFDSTDLEKTEALIEFSDKILKEILPENVSYQFAERYYNKIVETKQIKTDILALGSLSIFIIAFILYLYLKSFRALMVIFAPVLMGLGITTGLTYYVIGHMNIITGFLIGIVSGLGVDYGIHMVLRLKLEYKEPSSDDPDPIWRTLKSSGHSVFVGAFSASLAFFFLCFSSFKAFSEFGFVCGVGITAVFLCLLISFSALVRFFKVDKIAITNMTKKSWTSGKLLFPVLSLPRGYWAGIILTVFLFVGSLKAEFEFDFTKMMQHSKETKAMFELVDGIYDRSSIPSAIATETKEEALAVEDLIKEKYKPSLVSEIISGASIIPDNMAEKHTILLRIRDKIKPIKNKWIEEGLGVPASSVRTWLDAKPFTFAQIPAAVQDALRGTRQSGYLIYLYPAIKLDEAVAVRTYANMIREIENRNPKIVTGSDAVIFSDILDLIQKDGFLLLALIFISVGIFIYLSERNVKQTLISYLPLLISLPVGMGLMAIFGVKFNIFNIAIIPTFVAMGIDVPIHIGHRANEVGSGYKAVRDLAASINLALMTAAVGFGVLIFARAGVLKSLGWIALLGTLGIWWVGLFVLPAYLERVSRKKTP